MTTRLSRLSRARRASAFVVAAFALAMIIVPWQEPPSSAQTTAQTPAPAAESLLLVLNKAENSLAMVDPSTMQVVARVPVGIGPHEVATSADGRTAYVANYGTQQVLGDSISVIDIAARKELKKIDLGALKRPHGIAERDGKIYFTSELSRAVARLDPATERVDWVMGTGQKIGHMLVVHPKRPTIYTINLLNDNVSVLELDKGGEPGPPPRITHVAVGKGPEGADISPDGRELWVGHNGDGGVSIIDTETNKVKETIKAGGVPIRVKFTPDGKYVLISNPEGGDLAIFDAATRKELKRLPVGEAAVGVIVAPDSRRAFVATMASGKVFQINLESMTVAGSVETGKGPDGLGWVGK
ncbi:MAG TPA: YncE family protein [Pyrinomonadaceae bacterium]|nr:YncE family protein [Pyrinomonadaceae bacterium]